MKVYFEAFTSSKIIFVIDRDFYFPLNIKNFPKLSESLNVVDSIVNVSIVVVNVDSP